MTKFQDHNERRKEMAYYTYDEFKKFISYEDDNVYLKYYITVDFVKEN